MLRILNLKSLCSLSLGARNMYKCFAVTTQRRFHQLNNPYRVKPLLSTCLNTNGHNMIKRFKKGKKKKHKEEDEEESDEDNLKEIDELDKVLADENVLVKDFQDITIDIPNIRLDVVLKAGLPLTRAKVEEGFYENRIRVNGERVTKKNSEVAERDELDYILGRNPENNNLLDVKRIQVMHLPDQMSSTGRTKLKIRRYYTITIENYSDPYESMVVRAPLKEEEYQTFKNKK